MARFLPVIVLALASFSNKNAIAESTTGGGFQVDGILLFGQDHTGEVTL